MEEQNTNTLNEILTVVRSLDNRVGSLESKVSSLESNMVTKAEFADGMSNMVTKVVFEEAVVDLATSLNYVTQNVATDVQLIESEARMKKYLDNEFIKDRVRFPDKDFVSNRIGELKGEFVEALKKNNEKTNKLAEILKQREVINDSDENEVRSIKPFSRPAPIALN
jgi:hypothetical protein